jgi:hypothetical protein
MHLSGENSFFFLVTVISVICVCILMVSCSVSLIGCAGLVGISLASWVTCVSVCVSPRCVECRAGTSIFCHFVDVGGGTVWIFYFPWLRFGVYGTIEQVGVAGQYGFLVSLALFWGVQYDGNGGAGVLCFTFHFSQFAVSSLGGWICAVGILRFYPLWYL